jgi:hypothetical protein
MYINPVERTSVQGRHKQVFTVISENGELIPSKTMRKNKEFGTSDIFSFPFDSKNNKLYTGLDELIPNEFFDLDPVDVISKYALGEEWYAVMEKIVKSKTIKRQTMFEIIDGVRPDFYTAEVNGTVFRKDYKRTDLKGPNYLQDFALVLYDGPNYFESTTSRGRLAMQLAKIHPRIAKSKAEVNSAVHWYYISQENEAETESLKRQDLLNKAIYHLYEVQNKFSDFKRYQLASVLKDKNGNVLVRGTVSPSKVSSELNKYIHNSGSSQSHNINEFIEHIEMLSDKDQIHRFNVKYLIQQALNEGIIGTRDGFFVWYSQAGVENVYKFRSIDQLHNFFIGELKTYNPKDKELTNYYKILVDELLLANVKLEIVK